MAALVAGCDASSTPVSTPRSSGSSSSDAPSVLGWREWHEAAEAASALGVLEFGLQGRPRRPGAIGNVAVFAHLVLGALNEAGMFIAHPTTREAARDEVRRARCSRMRERLRRCNE